MSKIYLGLSWTNHVQVTRTGGKKVYRDENYTELVESEDLLSRILSRVRRVHGAESKMVNKWFNQYHSDVKKALKSNCPVRNTVMHGARKMFTYEIRPLDLRFNISGADYKIANDGQVMHIGGARPWLSQSGKVHKGENSPENKQQLKEWTEAHSVMDAPFSKVPEDKPKGKASKVVKQPPKVNKGKQKEPAKPPVKQPDKTSQTPSGKQLSKRQQNECIKWGIDPDNLPKEKPKGMNNKIWKALAAKAA